jgi:hypothetical protein
LVLTVQKRAKPGIRVQVTVSRKAHELLQLLADQGLWGRSDRQVAARLIEDALVKLFAPELKLPAPQSDEGSPEKHG